MSLRAKRVGFVMSAVCPVYAQQHTLPDQTKERESAPLSSRPIKRD